jgi:hypothetical protein
MNKLPSGPSASCVITIKKVSGSIVHAVYARFSHRFQPLSIYYIFNVNNDAVTQRPICRAFLRDIFCAVSRFSEFRRTLCLLVRDIMYAPVFVRVDPWLHQTANLKLQTA